MPAFSNAVLAVIFAAKVRLLAVKLNASMPAKAWLMAKLPLAVRARLPLFKLMPDRMPTVPTVKSFKSFQANGLFAPLRATAKVSTSLTLEKVADPASMPRLVVCNVPEV